MSEWRSGDTLAWTQRDGVTPPPNGANRWLLGSLALSLSGVWIGLISTDALCPDHRLWVQSLGTVALAAAVWAIVGLIGQRSWAVLAALASALFGIAVGFIDMVHSATRGAILSIAFAVVAVGVLVAAVPVLRSALWLRRAERQLAPVDPWAPEADDESATSTSKADPRSGQRTSHQSTGSRDRT
jgi:hypothetical protein